MGFKGARQKQWLLRGGCPPQKKSKKKGGGKQIFEIKSGKKAGVTYFGGEIPKGWRVLKGVKWELGFACF